MLRAGSQKRGSARCGVVMSGPEHPSESGDENKSHITNYFTNWLKTGYDDGSKKKKKKKESNIEMGTLKAT